MNHPETTKQKILIWGILLLISLSVHFFCNIFSPIFHPYIKTDPMMFYMAGKAWMNGMVPYVDFIDVKGPLLWLFYGLGYLITPDKTVGVYLLLSIFTTITLWYIYRTARILDLNKSSALLACGIATFAIFNTETSGGRAEDILHPFIAALLFYFIQYLSSYRIQTNEKEKLTRNVAWASGICTASAILIKYNNITIGICTVFLVFYIEWKNKTLKNFFFNFLLYFSAGILILILPFCIILLIQGALDDCILTYFIINSESSSYLFTNIPNTITRILTYSIHNTKCLYIITILCLLHTKLFPNSQKDINERIFIIILLIATYIPNSIFHSSYYLRACAPFLGITAICIAKQFKYIAPKKVIFPLFSIILLTISFNGLWSQRAYFRIKEKLSNEILAIEKELQTIPSPKIIYYNELDFGFGLKASALPGCPYWTRLNGLHNICNASHIQAIKNRNTDFIIHIQKNQDIPLCDESFFNKYGYYLSSKHLVQNIYHVRLYKKIDQRVSNH